MKFAPTDFEFKACIIQNLKEIIALQTETIAQLSSTDLLRQNTEDMLKECLLPPHFTLGALHNNTLAGFTVLYLPTTEKETLSLDLQGVDIKGLKTANYKLCIVKNDYRGNALQFLMGEKIDEYAINHNINMLCATASPKNLHSKNNLVKMGYIYNKTLTKYGFERDLYYKLLNEF